jgi:hypothetical protein
MATKKIKSRPRRATKAPPKPALFTPEDRAELQEKVAKRAGSEPPEPVFTLTQIAQAFGFGYGTYVNGKDPLYFALNSLDDAHRMFRLIEECLQDGVETSVLQDVVSNAAMRAECAQGVLTRFTHPRAEMVTKVSPAVAGGAS